MACEAVEEAVEDAALAVVEREGRESLPEAGFGEDGGEQGLGIADGAAHAGEEPFHPGSDVERGFLGAFQDGVVVVAFLADLGRHAVEALRALLGTGQGEVGNGSVDSHWRCGRCHLRRGGW